jgi:hypothetical protein
LGKKNARIAVKRFDRLKNDPLLLENERVRLWICTLDFKIAGVLLENRGVDFKKERVRFKIKAMDFKN